MHEYDTSSKYMIQRHGDSILRMAGSRDIASWKPLQAELIKHRRLPDGLIEVRHRGEKDRDSYLILGGRKAMIESPLYQELKEELTRVTLTDSVMTVLVRRFGRRARALKTKLRAIDDETRLRELLGDAVDRSDLASFREKLAP